MNCSSKLRFGFNLAIISAVACLLIGCIYPHTTQRSQEIRGRVLDAKTHQPIHQAKVYFCEPPYHTTYTDTNGCFVIKATKNFHWLAGADGSGYPPRKTSGLRITHENYATNEYWGGDVMQIFLEPNSK